ncbi:hypothetical protein [Micromonospora sp. WMMD712]|uniref:hypothetical protein n=1 Tax=Micromonospora sp. WMMD712 TaxID=3016096 RepID=UPI00249BBDE2|nr:hypothetical protein [Micromonospora sp. WMMD712]WFE55417.1 hypothetical protein O7633_00425 [Micromonospora sp. WMMD712]
MSRLDDRAADVTGDRVHHPIRIGGEGRFHHRPPVAELDGAGEAYRVLGRPEEAVAFHLCAATTHCQLGDTWQLALTLDRLAAALAEADRPEEGAAARQEARGLLATFGDSRAAALLDYRDAVGRD